MLLYLPNEIYGKQQIRRFPVGITERRRWLADVESETPQVPGCVGFSAAGSPNSLSTIAVGLCLDDRADAVDASGHEASWREWLRLSNLLALKPIGLTIGSVSSSVAETPSIGEAALMSATDFGPVWNALLEDAMAWERDFLVELAKADLQLHPELGFEVEGLPVSIAWPAHQITIVGDHEEHEQLERAGWTVIDADPSAVLDLLKSKGA